LLTRSYDSADGQGAASNDTEMGMSEDQSSSGVELRSVSQSGSPQRGGDNGDEAGMDTDDSSSLLRSTSTLRSSAGGGHGSLGANVYRYLLLGVPG
jgi:hypothetical protein